MKTDRLFGLHTAMKSALQRRLIRRPDAAPVIKKSARVDSGSRLSINEIITGQKGDGLMKKNKYVAPKVVGVASVHPC